MFSAEISTSDQNGQPQTATFETIGQYLQPTPKHAALDRFVPPDEFDELAQMARAKGFLMVSSSPLTRSSHHAGDDFARLKAAREARETV